MNTEIIVSLISSIVVLCTLLAKIYADRLKRKKETQSLVSFWKQTIVKLESRVVELLMLSNKSQQKLNFVITFQNTIDNRSELLLRLASSWLHDEYETVLDFWAETIKGFGLKIYNSSYRAKGGIDLLEFTQSNINRRKTLFTEIMDIHIPDRKNEIKFSQFVKDSGIHKLTDELIKSLEAYDLTGDETIELFDNYVVNFYGQFLKIIAAWEKFK